MLRMLMTCSLRSSRPEWCASAAALHACACRPLLRRHLLSMPLKLPLSRLLLDREYARREAAASRDPRFSHLDWSSRRSIPLEEMRERSAALASFPERPWVPLLRFLEHRPVRRALRTARHARQRLQRGWDDSAVWSLDSHLCRTLGDQLVALADSPFGWPGEPWESPAHWEQELRANGAALTRYTERFSIGDDPRFDAITDPDATPTQRREALDALHAEEQRVTKEAQAALVWVAGVLPHLWD